MFIHAKSLQTISCSTLAPVRNCQMIPLGNKKATQCVSGSLLGLVFGTNPQGYL
jgi:hypothetical protein